MIDALITVGLTAASVGWCAVCAYGMREPRPLNWRGPLTKLACFAGVVLVFLVFRAIA